MCHRATHDETIKHTSTPKTDRVNHYVFPTKRKHSTTPQLEQKVDYQTTNYSNFVASIIDNLAKVLLNQLTRPQIEPTSAE